MSEIPRSLKRVWNLMKLASCWRRLARQRAIVSLLADGIVTGAEGETRNSYSRPECRSAKEDKVMVDLKLRDLIGYIVVALWSVIERDPSCMSRFIEAVVLALPQVQEKIKREMGRTPGYTYQGETLDKIGDSWRSGAHSSNASHDKRLRRSTEIWKRRRRGGNA